MKRASSILALVLLLAFPAAAQDAPTEADDGVGERSTAFEAVEGASRENVSGLGLMVGAYGLVWAFTMLYLVRLGRLESQLSADIERLEKVLPADDAAKA